MSGVASVHKVMAGLQGKAERNEFLLLPLLRHRFSLLTIIDLFLVALLSFVCFLLTDSLSIVLDIG